MIRALTIAALVLLPALSFAGGGKNLEVKIKDGQMDCEECAKSVTAALNKIPNVEQGSVKIVLAKNKATLHVSNETKETVTQIKAALKDAGYDVTGVTEVASASATGKTTTTTKTTETN